MLRKRRKAKLFAQSHTEPSPVPYVPYSLCVFISQPPSENGDSQGESGKIPDDIHLSRFPLEPSGESEDHTEGPRRLFAYFLVGEKV